MAGTIHPGTDYQRERGDESTTVELGLGDRPERPEFQCTLSVVAESRPQNPWVGLLTRKERIVVLPTRKAASPSPAVWPSGYLKRHTFTYSGATAPDLHRLPFYARVGTQGETRS